MNKILFLMLLFCAGITLAQTPNNLGGLDFDYANPQTFEIGPVRVIGADNYDHQAIKLIAGLRTGQKITLPSQQINKAIQNLWAEGLFSDVAIYAEKEIGGIVYLVIELSPRPKLSKFRFVGVNKREADKLEAELGKVHERLAKIETSLGDSAVYEAARKDELRDLLAEQAKLKVREGQLEETWMEALELLETLQAELEALS